MIIKQHANLTIRLISYLDSVFPELLYFFNPLCSKKLYTLSLRRLQYQIISMHMIHLAHLLQSAPHGHFGKEMEKDFSVLSQKSIGINDSSLSIQITQTYFLLFKDCLFYNFTTKSSERITSCFSFFW